MIPYPSLIFVPLSKKKSITDDSGDGPFGDYP